MIVDSKSSQLPPADAFVEVTATMLAIKRSAGVAPEVDLRECTLHSPLQKQANKAEHTLALKPRDATRNPKQVYQWPQNRTVFTALQIVIVATYITGIYRRNSSDFHTHMLAITCNSSQD